MELKFEPFYQQLLDELAAYTLAISTVYSDQMTIAPKKGAMRANEALAFLSGMAFKLENDPEMVKKIEAYAASLPEDSLEKKELDLRLRSLEDTKSIPSDVYQKSVQERANAETAWHEAKEKSNYELFKPHLKNVVNNSLELERYSPRFNGHNSYDLLLDKFEPGMDTQQYDAFFEVLKEELIPFIEKIRKAKQIDTTIMTQDCDVQKQDILGQYVLDLLKADRDRVYMGTTEHPFTNFLSHDDVRITTHYYPHRLMSAVLSTVHEYGHALYALQTDPDFDKTALADAIGCAAHESQSRFLENHVGRTQAFWDALYPKIVELFPQFQDVSKEELYRMVNASECALIRTEADELTYPLHILIRYEIEKMMADGSLNYDELPTVWADKYEQYLGVRPQNDQEGVLQDMHWSAGDIGYFPSYALGSAFAAQLYEKMAEELDVSELIANNEFETIAKWLEENIHHYGALKPMKEIVEEVSGKPFDPYIYTNYLKDKYSKLYNLEEE